MGNKSDYQLDREAAFEKQRRENTEKLAEEYRKFKYFMTRYLKETK